VTDTAAQEQVAAVGTDTVGPAPGEVITSLATGTSYVMGEKIGEGYFGVVYECWDGWDNELAAKILKPTRTMMNWPHLLWQKFKSSYIYGTRTLPTHMTHLNSGIAFTSLLNGVIRH
jgi:hypothetical protein